MDCSGLACGFFSSGQEISRQWVVPPDKNVIAPVSEMDAVFAVHVGIEKGRRKFMTSNRIGK